VQPFHLAEQGLHLAPEGQQPLADCRHPEAPAPRRPAARAARCGPAREYRLSANGAWLAEI